MFRLKEIHSLMCSTLTPFMELDDLKAVGLGLESGLSH